MNLTFIFFGILAVLAIGSGIVTITSRNAVKSAFSLVVHFFMLAGLYLTLRAQFVAVLQILVYAGAIMVLVIFVIMLLNLKDEEKLKEKIDYRIIIAIAFAFIFVIQFAVIFFMHPLGKNQLAPNSTSIGTVQSIGTELFTNYLFPFEAISLLLLAAIVGAVILAKRKID